MPAQSSLALLCAFPVQRTPPDGFDLPRDASVESRAFLIMWRHWVGRALQFLGLLILPFAMASELMEKVGLGQSMLIAAGGAAVFYVGFQLQHKS